jgi:cytochrome b
METPVNSKTAIIWDKAVRIFHWAVVVAFFTAYATSEGGPRNIHEFAGYTILALVSFRVIWGFVGSKHARFSDFVGSPASVIAYARSLRARKPKQYLGHNPLGGYMVIALIVMLFVITLAGNHLQSIKDKDRAAYLATAGLTEEQAKGQQIRVPKTPKQRQWKEIHETAVNITLLLVVLHVLGVVMSSRLHKENLVKAMITGHKERRND